jgi:xyloglucan-specific endo-beta-1,4-glucanase
MKVYSFLTTTPNSPYTNFSADVKLFFNYLTKNQQYPESTQNLIGELAFLSRWMRGIEANCWVVYQVGTEAFTGGPASFTVDEFSASVNV